MIRTKNNVETYKNACYCRVSGGIDYNSELCRIHAPAMSSNAKHNQSPLHYIVRSKSTLIRWNQIYNYKTIIESISADCYAKPSRN